MHNLLMCLDATPNLLGIVDTSIAPTLLFYSYIPIAIISLIFGLFVFKGSKRSLTGKLVLLISILFFLWIFSAILTWIAVYASIVHFFWQIIGIIEIFIYIISFYFIYVFLNNKDLPFFAKLIIFVISLPVIVTLPTTLNMVSFDLANCRSNYSIYWGYIYVIEIVSIVFIGWMCLKKFFDKTVDNTARKESLFLMSGVILFLGFFTITNVIGDSTLFYQVNLLGPIGMVAFLGLLTFMIVRFKALNIKLLATQALVWVVVILIGSQFFFIQSDVNKILNSFTLIATFVLSLIIVKSVKKVDEQREALDLVNQQQTNLLHFISHQVKGFFTKSRNAFSGLLEGDYGPLPETARKIVQEGFDSDNRGVETVQQILNAANLKTGTTTYSMTDTNLINLIKDKVLLLKSNAEKKNLILNFNSSAQNILIKADASQIGEALKNLIDNSIRYTPAGKIDITVEQTLADKNPSDKKVIIKISDTGIGISADDIKNLFREGGRGKESIKVNVDSTGYGLYIVKNIVEAHGGTVSVFSAGAGLGSTFTVVLPVK
jgi:signal transduction histidine kinase